MGSKVSTSKPSAASTVPTVGKKAALLFGLNYSAASQGCQLQGCINDVYDVKDLLVSTGKVPASQITIYTDDTFEGRQNTSVSGMKKNLSAIAKRSWTESLELVYVHFSGHGCQVPDFSKEEVDGMDEAIVPCDFERSGVLVDDWLRDWSNGMMNPKTKLVIVFDSCHSGSALDLVKVQNRQVIFISGCKDEQTSADAYNVDGRFRFTGALTACLVKVLKDQPALWNDVETMVTELKKLVLAKGFDQIPVLSTAHDTTILKTFM